MSERPDAAPGPAERVAASEAARGGDGLAWVRTMLADRRAAARKQLLEALIIGDALGERPAALRPVPHRHRLPDEG